MPFIEITEIHHSPDNFSFTNHGISCFTVPKYLATRAFGPSNRELFYSYLYLFYHYNLINALATHRDEVERYVLNSKLGLTVETHPAEDRLVEKIREAVDHGWPVFVPVDSKDLFYHRNYRNGQQPHLLLMKGYNPDTGIFTILDWEQNVSLLLKETPNLLMNTLGSFYSDFYLPWDMVDSLHRSYSGKFEYLSGEYQIMKRVAPSIEALDPFRDMAELLKPMLDDVHSLIVPKLSFLENQPPKNCLALINSQVVLIKSLVTLIDLYSARASMRQELEESGLAACSAWKEYATKLIFLRFRQSQDTRLLDQSLSRVLAAEQSFIKTLWGIGC